MRRVVAWETGVKRADSEKRGINRAGDNRTRVGGRKASPVRNAYRVWSKTDDLTSCDIAGNEGAPLSVIHEIALHAALVRAQRPTLPRSPTSASLDGPRRRRSRSGSRTPKGLSRSLSPTQSAPPRLLISGSRTPRSARRRLLDP